MGYNVNDYGEVFNGPDTFAQLRLDLVDGPVMLNWIDQLGTLLQVCFVRPKIVGQGGGPLSNPQHELIVAVMGHGAYGFTGQVAPSYAAEKLGVRGDQTNRRLCDLINAALQADQVENRGIMWAVYDENDECVGVDVLAVTAEAALSQFTYATPSWRAEMQTTQA